MVRVKASRIIKIATVFAALGGVILSLFTAVRDGYSHWGRRLLYFTAQSNVWLGVTFLLLLFVREDNERGRKILYLLKYVFTVSITVTGLIFCGLLAPFAGEDYRPWTIVNFFTHVLSPVLAIVDFFVDETPIPLQGKRVLLALAPPLLYFAVSELLVGLNVDFGRGVPYPYFFLNYRSPAGIFGFSGERPFFVGSFYWLAIFAVLIVFLAVLYDRAARKK